MNPRLVAPHNCTEARKILVRWRHLRHFLNAQSGRKSPHFDHGRMVTYGRYLCWFTSIPSHCRHHHCSETPVRLKVLRMEEPSIHAFSNTIKCVRHACGWIWILFIPKGEEPQRVAEGKLYLESSAVTRHIRGWSPRCSSYSLCLLFPWPCKWCFCLSWDHDLGQNFQLATHVFHDTWPQLWLYFTHTFVGSIYGTCTSTSHDTFQSKVPPTAH